MSQRTDRERIGILESRLDDNERRIRIQEDKNDSLSEIVTYIKLQSEHNKKQDEQLEKLTKVMHDIHINLAGLNKDVKEVKNDVGDVAVRVDEIEGERVKHLEDYKNRSIKFYLGILSAVVIAGLLIWLGF